VDPDTTWLLKAVACPKEGYKDSFNVRIFDPVLAASKKISVKSYHSLAEHP